MMIIKLNHYISYITSENERVCKCYDGETKWMHFLIKMMTY